MKLSFHGAAGFVTGSNYLLETDKTSLLVDCGMFQGSKDTVRLNYRRLPYDCSRIPFLLLTHAHIDHTGLIPKLVKNGFKGRVIGTHATIDLCRILLEDSAHIQEKETEDENRRRLRDGLEPREPIYTSRDVAGALKLLESRDYGTTFKLGDSIEARFLDAGHILGSAILELKVTEAASTRKIVFPGDIGQWNIPIINDPTLVSEADFSLIESTYGDRLHEKTKNRDELLIENVNETFKKKGRLLIPAFSIERTQEIIYAFYKAMQAGKFPDQKIFLDSPLAIKATRIFLKHSECFDEEARKVFARSVEIPGLENCETVEQSKGINAYDKPCIVLAGNGMCTAGRIRHHLRTGLSDKRNTVLMVGYQAEGSLGRILLNGVRQVKMMGLQIKVAADIRNIGGFSAHADYSELMKWAGGFNRKPRMFVVHGEPVAAKSLSEKLVAVGFKTYIPGLDETVEL